MASAAARMAAARETAAAMTATAMAAGMGTQVSFDLLGHSLLCLSWFWKI